MPAVKSSSYDASFGLELALWWRDQFACLVCSALCVMWSFSLSLCLISVVQGEPKACWLLLTGALVEDIAFTLLTAIAGGRLLRPKKP